MSFTAYSFIDIELYKTINKERIVAMLSYCYHIKGSQGGDKVMFPRSQD